jgi:serine/threonine protein kinase
MNEDPPSPRLQSIMTRNGYDILSKIGTGRTANVYLIANTRWPDRRFVVKQVDLRANHSLRARELPILSSLTHPNVINIYDSFEEAGIGYLILEYCPGGTLMDLIKSKGPLPTDELYRCCNEVANGLAYCHSQGISHGDIKPDNILLDSHRRCKLADFGLGRQVDSTVASTDFVGSLAFMAPEVLTRHAFDPFVADIWSLGITFYWMGRGSSPFRLTDAARLLRDTQCGLPATASKSLPPSFLKLLRQMVNPNAENRIALVDVISQLVMMAETTRSPGSNHLVQCIATKTMPLSAARKLPRMLLRSGTSLVLPKRESPAKAIAKSQTFVEEAE